ncbi:EF-hand domain-containing protein [Rhodoferax sp. 4810]|nr:EF-hand domain-containing protein [Rhodoferax jenense]
MTFRQHTLISAVAASILSVTASALWAQTTAPGPTSAAAQSSSSDMLAAFDKADSNKTGKLTKEQAKAVPGLSPSFDTVDANHDGMVSREELEKALK